MKEVDLGSSKIIIARKLTDIEYVMGKKRLEEQKAIDKALKKGVDGERQVGSHLRFKDNFRKLLENLPEGIDVVSGENLSRELVRPKSLLITFGGDDYFKYASQFIEDEYILGINGDPKTSNGALTSFDIDSFIKFLPALREGNFEVENWSRLTTSIDGKLVPELAISEIFIGSPFRKRSSKYSLEYKNLRERLSNSGLLIATGTGSTGWYRAAASCEHEEAETFSRTKDEARFYTTEAFFGRLNSLFPRRGQINFDEKLTVTNTSHYSEIVSIDSIIDYPFKRGQIAEIGLSKSPLKVVTK